MENENKPNLFIVGAARCGTTSLHNYLKQIPGIYMSELKEPHFFSSEFLPDHYRNVINNEKDYRKLFEGITDEKIIGETSPSYFWKYKVASKIYKFTPKGKIIIMLRDPIERAYSHYMMDFNKGIIKIKLKEMLEKLNSKKTITLDMIPESIQQSFYHDAIKEYVEIFGRKNVKCIIFEEFQNNEKQIIQDILQFLNFNGDLTQIKIKKENPLRMPKGAFGRFILKHHTIRNIAIKTTPKKIRTYIQEIALPENKKIEISKEHKRFLKKLFSEDVIKVQKLLNTDLPWMKN